MRRPSTWCWDRHPIDVVIHFAAKKAVGESTLTPLTYWDINVRGRSAWSTPWCATASATWSSLSSCSIYGEADTLPITEGSPARPTNPYARSKWVCEQFLRDVTSREPEMSVICLRYFNPVGAHPSGELGEDPTGVPNNVMPYAMQVAVGRLPELTIFGGDYTTVDGTGVRDYIHVVDLARGHRMAIDHLRDRAGVQAFNLGTGVGDVVEPTGRRCREGSRSARSRGGCSPDATVTWPSWSRTRRSSSSNGAGARRRTWKPCARTPGGSSR